MRRLCLANSHNTQTRDYGANAQKTRCLRANTSMFAQASLDVHAAARAETPAARGADRRKSRPARANS